MFLHAAAFTKGMNFREGLLGMEKVNTLLILRYLMLGSRNLPIMLYRVHLQRGP
jgi:hypothetical protein